MASGIRNRNTSQQTLDSMLEHTRKSKLLAKLEKLETPDELIAMDKFTGQGLSIKYKQILIYYSRFWFMRQKELS